MPDKRPPKDPNQLAKYIVDVTAGDAEKIEAPLHKPNPRSKTPRKTKQTQGRPTRKG